MRHLKFVVNCALVFSPVVAFAQDSARTVQYHSQDIIPIRAKVKYTTLAVDVEAWSRTMPLARGSRAKIRNLMSALFSHAIRWEWTERNPIKSVRQSAKRMRTPDVLTPEEIMALLKELPEPLRTAAELDAFTGLRRGELIGLQWEDVDFENLVIHVRRSVVMMVQGAPKTEASAKDVPLDAALAESLLKLRLTAPYNRETDWVFASPTMKGKQPLWPETLWRRYGRPAVKAAKIQKRVGFHTFRHTYTTLLTQNNEEVKVVQELLRHANSRITLDLYAQAGMPNKRLAQSRLVRMVLNKGEGTGLTGPNWTMTQIANSLQVLERIGGDDETRTRDLCRDSEELTSTFNNLESTDGTVSL